MTCIIALCSYFSYKLSTKEDENVDTLGSNAWKNSSELIPDFDTLFK